MQYDIIEGDASWLAAFKIEVNACLKDNEWEPLGPPITYCAIDGHTVILQCVVRLDGPPPREAPGEI